MNYNDLLELLQSNDVYNSLKLYENELFSLIPELKLCKGFNQKSKWHIYDVYEHILHVVANTNSNKYLRLAALFHDVGKPFTFTEDENGIGHFYGHWNKSIEIFNNYYNEFNLSDEEYKLINNLIYYHDLNIGKMNNAQIKTLINNIGINNIKLLFDLKRADLLAQNSEYHNLLENIDIQYNQVKSKILINNK